MSFESQSFHLSQNSEDVYRSIRADLQQTEWKEDRPDVLYNYIYPKHFPKGAKHISKRFPRGILHSFSIEQPKLQMDLSIAPDPHDRNQTVVFIEKRKLTIRPFWHAWDGTPPHTYP